MKTADQLMSEIEEERIKKGIPPPWIEEEDEKKEEPEEEKEEVEDFIIALNLLQKAQTYMFLTLMADDSIYVDPAFVREAKGLEKEIEGFLNGYTLNVRVKES